MKKTKYKVVKIETLFGYYYIIQTKERFLFFNFWYLAYDSEKIALIFKTKAEALKKLKTL